MADYMEARPQQNPFMSDSDPRHRPGRTVPIVNTSTLQSTPPRGDPMDLASPRTAPMGPPLKSNEEHESNGNYENMGMNDQHHTGNLGAPSAAAAGLAVTGGPNGQQPKVVQTAFIHKLYNMLEDQNISNLISWSGTNDSFIMSPSNDFSKVLSQYFKHTNISSFVRQLNMYGFHKVSDVFHQATPDSPLWEFKHGGGSFRRGDLVGLREIKRRASRHSLVHRDSYSNPKPPMSQPGTPAEPIHSGMQESTETRLSQLENHMYDVHARLQKSEDNSSLVHVRNQVVMNALVQSLQLNHDLSRAMLSMTSTENPMYRDLIGMQNEIQRQTDVIRSFMDEPQQPDNPFSSSRQYFSNLNLDNAPASPRQMPLDSLDPRRAPPPPQLSRPPPNNYYRYPTQTHLSITPRRYGSIGANTSQSSPSSLRSQMPQPPPPPHPLQQSMSSPPMGRRHTSADIRMPWQGNHQPGPSPFASGHSSSAYPSSPKRGPLSSEEQHIRESFSNYSFGNPAPAHGRSDRSRPATPPFTNGNSSMEHLNQFSLNAPSMGSRERGAPGMLRDNSGPPTRRGSMAHILNPAETAEREEEHEEEMREEDRKRKRRD